MFLVNYNTSMHNFMLYMSILHTIINSFHFYLIKKKLLNILRDLKAVFDFQVLFNWASFCKCFNAQFGSCHIKII